MRAALLIAGFWLHLVCSVIGHPDAVRLKVVDEFGAEAWPCVRALPTVNVPCDSLGTFVQGVPVDLWISVSQMLRPLAIYAYADSGGFLSGRSNGVVIRPVTDSLSWFRNYEPSHNRVTRTGVLVWDWTLTRADSGVGAVMPVADVQHALAARICLLYPALGGVPLGDGTMEACP